MYYHAISNSRFGRTSVDRFRGSNPSDFIYLVLADSLLSTHSEFGSDDDSYGLPVLRSCTKDSDFISITVTWWNGAYDTKTLIFEASRNLEIPDAIENTFLDDESMYENNSLLAMANIIKDDDVPYSITRLLFRTVQDKFQVVEVADAHEIEPLAVPESLSHVQKAAIHDLKRVGSNSLSTAVDLVSWQGHYYAFKQVEDENYAGVVREINILDQLHASPHTVSLTAIAVRENRVQGFLMPYFPRGNLTDVFNRLRTVRNVAEGIMTIPLSIKLAWAQQIASGLADVHGISAYNGDLTLENVLLGDDGRIVLIDFNPVSLSSAFSAPELLQEWDTDDSAPPSFTPAADVYSLGLVLWAMAHETVQVDPNLPWHSSIPDWYKPIVKSCLSENPEDRPSAAHVRSLLSEGLNTENC